MADKATPGLNSNVKHPSGDVEKALAGMGAWAAATPQPRITSTNTTQPVVAKPYTSLLRCNGMIHAADIDQLLANDPPEFVGGSSCAAQTDSKSADDGLANCQ